MALKAVIQISDIDRGIYGDHALTIERHPSETDERMIIRLLAFALNVPPNNDVSVYSFASSTNVWWKAIESKLTRIQNLTVWISDGTRSIEVAPVRLCGDEVQSDLSRRQRSVRPVQLCASGDGLRQLGREISGNSRRVNENSARTLSINQTLRCTSRRRVFCFPEDGIRDRVITWIRCWVQALGRTRAVALNK